MYIIKTGANTFFKGFREVKNKIAENLYVTTSIPIESKNNPFLFASAFEANDVCDYIRNSYDHNPECYNPEFYKVNFMKVNFMAEFK